MGPTPVTRSKIADVAQLVPARHASPARSAASAAGWRSDAGGEQRFRLPAIAICRSSSVVEQYFSARPACRQAGADRLQAEEEKLNTPP
jgi:hypothetical protein